MTDGESLKTVTLTELAAARVRRLIEERNSAGYALRVFVSGGGCSGLRYGMALDGNPRPDDIQSQSNGVALLIDPVSIGYMGGSVIDYVDDPESTGFRIENPNAIASCGCGPSSGAQDSGDAACSESGCSGCG